MPPYPPCPKMKAQIYGAVPERPNPKMTYALAHSARCKLHISANRPDRNLRMVLGHAFALDNLLVRIVEIENDSAAHESDHSKMDEDATKGESEIAARDNAIAGIGGGAGVTVGETGSLARSQHQPEQKEQRRTSISFGNSANFRPSEYTSNGTNAKREKSPPPARKIPQGYSDDESTSSDNYDDDADAEVSFSRVENPLSTTSNTNNQFTDVPPQDPYENDDDEDSLSLTRFQSATATQPRRRPSPSPPASEPPALISDDEDDEPEDRSEPPSPTQLPDDVIRHALESGNKDEELGDLYETLRGCPCCKQHSSAPKPTGVWRVEGQGGKQYAVLTEEAEGKNGDGDDGLVEGMREVDVAA